MKGNLAARRAARSLDFSPSELEAELWTKGNPQVVVSTAIEEYVIASFEAQTNRSSEAFDSARGIQGKIGSAVGQTHGVHKTGRRILVINTEIVESNFTGHEDAEWARTGLEFRSEESVQRAEAGIHRGRGNSVGECAGVVFLKVVGHLRFQLDAWPNTE